MVVNVFAETIPEDFAGFINEYIEYATQNDSIKYYTIQSESAVVVSCIDTTVGTKNKERKFSAGLYSG